MGDGLQLPKTIPRIRRNIFIIEDSLDLYQVNESPAEVWSSAIPFVAIGLGLE